jgi:hypothetical protein
VTRRRSRAPCGPRARTRTRSCRRKPSERNGVGRRELVAGCTGKRVIQAGTAR